MDSLQRMKEFWSDNVNERREKLMPFTWNYMTEYGQIYGDRDLGNDVNVKNPYWISYPGRAEILSGFVDLKVNSNNYGINTNPNVLEFLNHQKGYEGKVVTFACWDATGRCLNKPNSKMLINVPWINSRTHQMEWENIEGTHLIKEEILANEIQHYLLDAHNLDAKHHSIITYRFPANILSVLRIRHTSREPFMY